MGVGRRASLTRSRLVRALSAMSLTLAVSSTGLVAFAVPALAVAPAPMLLTSPVPATDRDTTPTWTFDIAAGPTWECSVDLVPVAPTTWAPCDSGGYAAPTLTQDGDYLFSVRRVVSNDTADIASSAPYTLDTTATATVTPVKNPTHNPRPAWSIALEPGGTASCSLDAGPPSACTAGFVAASDQSEGTHSLEVTFSDVALNTGTTTSTVRVDRTAPPAPLPAGPPALSRGPDVTWTWAAPADTASAACTLTGPVTTVGPLACSSTTSFTRTVSDDGDYQLTVVLTDSADNVGVAGLSATFRYDATPPPAPVFASGPPATGTDKSPAWTFTTPGIATTCLLTSTTQGSRNLGPCQNVAPDPLGTASGTLLPDDSWILTVTTRDAAGNTAATASAPYLLDTTGPAAPVVTRPAALGNNPSPRFTWTGELPSTAVCRQVMTAGGVTTRGVWADCTGRYVDLALTADGDYQVEARLTDPLLNLGDLGLSAVYTYDGTAPVTPVLTGAPLLSNDPVPVYTFAQEPSGSATCTVAKGAGAPVTSDCSGGTFRPVLSGEGNYTLTVVTRDQAGNSSGSGTRTYALDLSAPGPATVTAPPSPGRDVSPAWDVVAGSGTTSVSCQLLGAPAAARPCTSRYVGDLTGLADGTYTLEVTAADDAGNTTVVTSPYTYDTTAPAPAAITGPVSPGNASSPSWTFPVQTGTTAQCRLVQGLSLGTWSACHGGTYSVTGLADGTYTVDVFVSDMAGNDAPIASSTPYRSDRTVPAQPVVSGPVGPGNDPAPVWSWVGEADARATCRLDRAGVIGSAVACDTGTFSPTLTGDTTYVVVVQLRDLAGNVSVTTTAAGYDLDTALPAQPVVAGPTGTGNDGNPVWTFSSESGSTTQCRLVRNGVSGSWGGCTSGQRRALPDDASYAVHVRVMDAARNVSPVGVSVSYRYDASAPVAPAVTAPPSPSAVRTPSWSFTSEVGTAAQCRLLSSGALSRDWVGCTSPAAIDLTGLPDSAYVVEVRVTDAALNTSPAVAALPYGLDTTPPPPPIVSGPSGPSTSAAPSFTWTGEAGTSSRCRLAHDGVLLGDVVCTAPYTPTLSGDGQWTLQVRLVDAAGNSSAAGQSGTYVLDTVAPVAPDVTAPPSPGRDRAPSWSAVVEPGATTECRLTGSGAVLLDWSSCRLPLTTDLTTRADGPYDLSVRATDAAGHTGAAGSASYVLDTAAPAAPAFTSLPASPASSRSLTFGFTAEAGVVLTCQLSSGARVVSADTTCTSPLRVSLTDLPDGGYTLSVRATDAAGNAGLTQTSRHVLDTGAPTAPSLVTGPAATAPDRTLTWTFSAESGARGSYQLDTTAPRGVLITPRASPSPLARPTWTLTGDADAVLQCRLSGPGLTGSAFTACAPTAGVPGAGSFTADLTTRPDGTYTLAARSRDAAGNVGPEATSAYEIDRVAPVAPPPPVAPPSPSQGAAISWDFTLEPASTGLCTLSSATNVVAPEQPCSSPWTTDLGRYGDGAYSLAVRAVDAAGNLSPTVLARYVLDRAAPDAPAITTTPGSPSPDLKPSWKLASSSAGDVLECQLIGSPTPVWGPCTDRAVFDLSPATAGTFQLQVRTKDVAGNVSMVTSSADYVLDLNAPFPPLVVPPVPQRDNILNPVFGLDRNPLDVDNASLLCAVTRFDGGPATATPCDPWVATTTVDLSQAPALRGAGLVVLGVRAVDGVSNTSGETRASYFFDNVLPVTPAILPLVDTADFAKTVQWTFGTADTSDTFRCELRKKGGIGPVTVTACLSPHDVTLPGTGKYTLSVRSVDLAGNLSVVPVTSTYTYLPPVPTAAVPRAVASSSDGTPAWSVVVPRPGYTATCSLSGPGGTSIDTRDCTFGTYTAPLTGLDGGIYTLAVQLTDSVGNVGKASTATHRFAPPTAGGSGRPDTTTPPPVGPPSGGAVRPPTSGPVAPPVVTPPTAAPVTGPGAAVGPPHSRSPVVPGPDRPGKPVAPPRVLVPPVLEEVPASIGRAFTDLGRKPTIPLLLLVVVVGFLLLQNQIDRRDPKLALAPVGAEPELDFGPVIGNRSSISRPLEGGAPT